MSDLRTERHPPACPACGSPEVVFRKLREDHYCGACEHTWTARAEQGPRPLRIFLSYGHDEHAADALQIKRDLEARGHRVWFDLARLREGRDWEAYIEEGLKDCDKVVVLMTPYSVRRRVRADPASRDGYCLNEIAKALERNKLIIPVLLVTLDQGPPTSICRIQYLDLRDAVPLAQHDARYQAGFQRLLRAIEQDDVDFEGGQARLHRLLRPLNFDADVGQHIGRFTGREWLFEALDTWLRRPTSSRVFWLTGGPGIGKTAIAAELCHRRPEVIAYHLCTHGHVEKADPVRAVLSIAYQMAQHLPEYGRRLADRHLELEVTHNVVTLFDDLIVQPLSGSFPSPASPQLVVIDALDEASAQDRNAIADLIDAHWCKTPAWLRLFITSRPEAEVVQALQSLQPFVLDAGRTEQHADLTRYLRVELERRGVAADAGREEAIVQRSEGLFLYAKVLLDDFDQGRLDLGQPNQLPHGLYGHYQRLFARQFPDLGRYRRDLLPVLQAICAQRAPLPLALLARITNATPGSPGPVPLELGSLFPIHVRGADGVSIAPCHRSIVEWLTQTNSVGQALAGRYHAAPATGHALLAQACLDDCHATEPLPYALAFAPHHALEAGRVADASALLSDVDYLYRRLRALGPATVSALESDLQRVAEKVSPALREQLEQWQGLLLRRGHDLRNATAGVKPEVMLLQGAWSDAVTSPLALAVTAWAAQHTNAVWLETLVRPRHPPVTASLRTLQGHTDSVTSVTLGCDDTVLSGSEDATVRVWDLATGECRQVLRGHRFRINAVAAVPGTTQLVSVGNDRTLRHWDWRQGRCLRVIETDEGALNAVVVLPDGRSAITGADLRAIRVWDLTDGSCLRSLPAHLGMVNALAITADAKTLASASGTGIILWDLASGVRLGRCDGHVDEVRSLAFSRDGSQLLSSSWDRTIKRWSVDSQACLQTLRGHEDGVNVARFLPGDAGVVSAAGNQMICDRSIRVWSPDGSTMRVIGQHAGPVTGLACTATGERLISASADCTLGIWDPKRESSPPATHQHRDGVCGIVVLPGGRRAVSASADKTLLVWDVTGGQVTARLLGHEARVLAVAALADGERIVSAGEDNLLRIWQVPTGHCLATLPCSDTPTALTTLAGSDTILVGHRNGELTLRAPGTGDVIRTLRGHVDAVLDVATLPGARWALSAGRDFRLCRWDLGDGTCHRLDGAADRVRAVSPLPDGQRFASVGWDQELSRYLVRIWHAGGGREALLGLADGGGARDDLGARWRETRLHGVASSHDGRFAASVGSEKLLRVYDVATGAIVAAWAAEAGLTCCHWSDGILAVGASDGTVQLLRLRGTDGRA